MKILLNKRFLRVSQQKSFNIIKCEINVKKMLLIIFYVTNSNFYRLFSISKNEINNQIKIFHHEKNNHHFRNRIMFFNQYSVNAKSINQNVKDYNVETAAVFKGKSILCFYSKRRHRNS